MSSGSSSLQANFIVYGQQNSSFDGFCGVWTIKQENVGIILFPYTSER